MAHHHDKHAHHAAETFRDKFWVTLALTLPVLLYSDMIRQWAGFGVADFAGSHLIPLIFSTAIFFYGGLVFIKGAWHELKGKRPGMMTLISLAIVTAYAYSVACEFFIEGEGFFWELATLITIMLLGHWVEMRSVSNAESALDAIAKLLPDKAEKLVDGHPTVLLASSLKPGDLVLVRPGTRVPTDGEVTEGTSSVSEAIITGESRAVAKHKGDQVIAGTINQDGALTVRVTKIGEDTALAGIMRLVAEAQTSKSNAHVLADKAAFALTIIALATGVLTFIFWTINKDAAFALERAVTVLVIACPHALGLAIPLVVSISTATAARNGLLVRKRLALETARTVDWVLFDKTGTLTRGELGVTDIWPAEGFADKDVLGIAASLEHKSEHFIAKGIIQKAKAEHIQLAPVKDFHALPGVGVSGKVRDKRCMAVSHRYLHEHGLKVPKEISEPTADEGKTIVYVLQGKKVIGALALVDLVREESFEAIQALVHFGMKTAMITGDSQAVAAYVARDLNLDDYFANVRPEDKAKRVKQLQMGGQQVAMVGDGVNDAPALSQADIGIAIGAGTDVAIKSADIILVKNDPRDVVKIIELSRVSYRKMRQNLLWATGYNVIAIPLAAGVLYGQGILLPPAAGAILMTASTLIVAVNAQLLRRLRF